MFSYILLFALFLLDHNYRLPRAIDGSRPVRSSSLDTSHAFPIRVCVCSYRRKPPPRKPPKPPPPQLLPPPPKPPKFPRSQPPPPPKFPPLLAPLSKPLKPPPQLREPQEEEAER